MTGFYNCPEQCHRCFIRTVCSVLTETSEGRETSQGLSVFHANLVTRLLNCCYPGSVICCGMYPKGGCVCSGIVSSCTYINIWGMYSTFIGCVLFYSLVCIQHRSLENLGVATSPDHLDHLLEISPYKLVWFSIECLSTSENKTEKPLFWKGLSH